VTLLQRIRTPFAESVAADEARMQPRMRVIGDALQERREELGLELDEIGAMLRIRAAYLAALEQGRYDDLPGPAYAMGFIRAYADFLGLNTEQVLARFKAEAAGVTAPPDLALPVPLGERSLPRGALVLVALIMALCGYGIWYYLSTEDRNRPQRVAAVPAALRVPTTPVLVAPPSAQPTAPADPVPNPASPSPPVPGVIPAPGVIGSVVTPNPPAPAVVPAPSTPAPKVPAMTAPPAVTPPPAATPAAAPKPQLAAVAPQTPPVPPPVSTPAPTAASKVSIRALADCWIQVRAPDQSIVFSRILKSGEVFTVPSRPGLSLRTGNAGALEIAVDGKPAPSIGSVGTLRRDVQLDPAELAAGTAVHG
jgi:cytoskeleton protein RodZ